MAIARSTRARVLCPAGRRHTLTTHLACLRLTSNTAPGAVTVHSHPQPSAWLPGYLRAPAAVRNPAAGGRWRRVREASYLLSYASPCLKLKLALVVFNVLRALPQSAAIRSHQPGRCGYLRAPAAVRNPAAGRWRRVREASYLLSYASPCLKLKLALVVLNVLRALPQSAAIRSHQPGRCGYLRAPAAVRNPAAGSSRPVEACASSSSPCSPVVLRHAAAAPRRSPRRQLPVVVRWYVLVARLVVVQLV